MDGNDVLHSRSCGNDLSARHYRRKRHPQLHFGTHDKRDSCSIGGGTSPNLFTQGNKDLSLHDVCLVAKPASLNKELQDVEAPWVPRRALGKKSLRSPKLVGGSARAGPRQLKRDLSFKGMNFIFFVFNPSKASSCGFLLLVGW